MNVPQNWPFVRWIPWSFVVSIHEGPVMQKMFPCPDDFRVTSLIQCKTDISRSCISGNWIYRCRMLDPIFWRPRARYFSRNRGNTLDPIRGRQFFAKSAHRDSLCSRFAGGNFSRNQLWPTCQCGLEHMLCDGQPSSAEHWHLHCIAE